MSAAFAVVRIVHASDRSCFASALNRSLMLKVALAASAASVGQLMQVDEIASRAKQESRVFLTTYLVVSLFCVNVQLAV